MPDFKHSSFLLEIVKYPRIQLDWKLVKLTVYWVQGIVKDACSLLSLAKSLFEQLIFLKQRGEDYYVETTLEDLSQQPALVQSLFSRSTEANIMRTLFTQFSKVFNVLNTLFKVSYPVNMNAQQSVKRDFAVDIGLTMYETQWNLLVLTRLLLFLLLLKLELFLFLG